jgi:hypothetical protein
MPGKWPWSKQGCRAVSSSCNLYNTIKDKDVIMQAAFSTYNTFIGPDFVIIVLIVDMVVESMCLTYKYDTFDPSQNIEYR